MITYRFASSKRQEGKVKEIRSLLKPLGLKIYSAKKFKINVKRILLRLEQGAQPSETVKNLLIKTNILSGKN